MTTTTSPAPPPSAFVESLPSWAAGLVRAVWAKQANTFALHGVPADLVPVRGAGGLRFLSLDDFLTGELFGGWPSIVTYNRAEGLGFASPAARGHFQDRLRTYDSVHGTRWADGLPRDAANCFALLDSYFRHCASLQPARPVVLLLPFAETLVPNAEAAYRGPEDRAVLVYLRKWSQDPVLLAKNIVVVLVTESLAELDPKLLRSHSTREIEIVRPDPRERLEYLEAVRAADWYGRMSDLPPARLAELTAGMTRVQIGQLLDGADAHGERLTRDLVRQVKKEVIETEGLGLLEYVEPKYDLSMVAGMPAVKDRLRRAARAIARGNPAAVPMGYLVCGPVGSAKTFLVECFSHEIGFPCVKLKNFRSMWVGSTESNLERILKILSSLTPVGVVVDEADAALGNREQAGDSGTQNRVFAQIASFMGDTRNRGKILWFLITARPDLLPIDLKRQGRAEEHIPLFYPESREEYDEIYRVMLKKLGVKTAVTELGQVATDEQLLGLSGSDLEAVIVRAVLEAEAAESAEVLLEHLKRAFEDFIPSINSREREMQILCAVLESTSRELLPPRFRELDRGAIQARVAEIKRELRMM
ncbi:MAG TPA: AAA family ATPase [Thermoanaerobaculia bacterium]|nr:AAA family ATPase [Thermoanaerobaculia bacterium]